MLTKRSNIIRFSIDYGFTHTEVTVTLSKNYFSCMPEDKNRVCHGIRRKQEDRTQRCESREGK